jgi:hypothetical protein
MSRKVHGESAGTRPKEANLSAIITVEFLRRVFAAKDPFVYIDANAGSGYNAMSNTHGSPLIALNNLRGWVRRSRWRQAPPCAAYLIERYPRHMASLRQALLARESQGRLFADDTVWPTLVFRESDNRFALPELAKTLIDTFGRGVHGVAFFDPNGIFTRDQSRSNSKLQWFPPIQELAAQLPNVAMVFDLNRDAASRVDGVRRNGQLRMAEPMWATDLLDAVRRRFALVTPM